MNIAACVGAFCLLMSRTAAVSHAHTMAKLASAATAHLQNMQVAGGAAAFVQMTQTANTAAAVKRIQNVSIMKAGAAGLTTNHITQEHQDLFSKCS